MTQSRIPMLRRLDAGHASSNLGLHPLPTKESKRRRRVAVAVIGCTALISALFSIPPALAEVGQATVVWPASVPVPAIADCASQGGGQPLTPASAALLPGGGYEYVFSVNGVENDYIVPPSGFQPLTSTDSALEEYGFPDRPGDSSGLAAWTQQMSAYKGVPPPSLCSEASGAPNSPGSGDSGGNTSANWGGYVAEQGAGGNTRYKDVTASYKEPPKDNCNCSNPTDASIWAGIGGYDDLSLLQAGTDMPNSGGQYSWYEYIKPCNNAPTMVCGATQEISVGSVSSGDSISTYTSYDEDNNLAHFEVDDNGSAVLMKVVTGLGSDYYDGNYAEWIAERPTYGVNTNNPYYENLTNFNQVNFSDCRVEYADDSFHNLQNETHYHVSMHPNGGDLLVNPNNLSDGTFTDTWANPN